ncbi:hypothetical protein CLOBOL_02906 [Enterocloster bolteae ATCC BAA-613]|uniref:Uncharacterized protein n=1 Tax=Enterocloster bolteae (strain ATCC BAA-613 / DSM 15670 / CCUG 46953 / JCM 12243 / WAL 16351) TaxID=411902 RepID=A8RR36_ENTBW|nr:hypothetical protein CLOBOL_02906 [Enterocloster bolteae ATCC BAA-613]
MAGNIAAEPACQGKQKGDFSIRGNPPLCLNSMGSDLHCYMRQAVI